LANKDELAAYKLELAKSLIPVFKDRATEEKPLMDILCNQCGIQQGDETYNALLKACLTNSALKNVPLLTADIQAGAIEIVRASNDPNTNPDPEFCQKVVQAKDTKAMGEIFDSFFGDIDRSKTDKQYASQGGVYKNASMLKADVNRNPLELHIGAKTILLSGNSSFFSSNSQSASFDKPKLEHCLSSSDVQFCNLSTEKCLNRMLEEIKNQGELSDEQALYVLKQVVLAYRGQNGASDCSYLFDQAFNQNSSDLQTTHIIGGEDLKISMQFAENDGNLQLESKTENSGMGAIKSIQDDGATITERPRFKYQDDTEIRTGLPVASTRMPTDDGTIQWSCLLRENPPKKVIFYGGCQPPPPPPSVN
jgi:hypothetical protein